MKNLKHKLVFTKKFRTFLFKKKQYRLIKQEQMKLLNKAFRILIDINQSEVCNNISK